MKKIFLLIFSIVFCTVTYGQVPVYGDLDVYGNGIFRKKINVTESLTADTINLGSNTAENPALFFNGVSEFSIQYKDDGNMGMFMAKDQYINLLTNSTQGLNLCRVTEGGDTAMYFGEKFAFSVDSIINYGQSYFKDSVYLDYAKDEGVWQLVGLTPEGALFADEMIYLAGKLLTCPIPTPKERLADLVYGEIAWYTPTDTVRSFYGLKQSEINYALMASDEIAARHILELDERIKALEERTSGLLKWLIGLTVLCLFLFVDRVMRKQKK